MTPLTPTEIESLRIAIAEECGWLIELDDEQFHAIRAFPPYTTSLDAIQAAAMERFNSLELAYLFEGELEVIKAETKTPFQHQLSALDWCIAYARTAKIWGYTL